MDSAEAEERIREILRQTAELVDILKQITRHQPKLYQRALAAEARLKEMQQRVAKATH
jgi:hypothetical protein